MDSSNPNEVLHAVLVGIAGVGVLITGESGVGKSDCALELVLNGHRLIADDVVEIERVGDTLVGKPPQNFAGLLEVRGLGIIDVRKLSGFAPFEPQQRIDLCIEFQDVESSEQPDQIGKDISEFEMFGIEIPKFRISIDRYRNLRALVETVVRLKTGTVGDDSIPKHKGIV